MAGSTPLTTHAAKLWPESFRGYALKNRDRALDVILIANAGRAAEAEEIAARHTKLNDGGESGNHRLSVIDAFSVKAPCGKLLEIAASDAVESVWYVHPKIYSVYVNIIRSLDKFGDPSQSPLVNISLSPPPELLPMPFRPSEPINRATKAAADKGHLILFAAGNAGPNEDSLNPWALAPWVVCVGATSRDGRTLAPFSARGRRDDPVYRPTVVCPGMDIEVPVTVEGETKVQVLSGTSFATPLAAQVAMQIVFFLYHMREEILKKKKGEHSGELTFMQIYAYNQGRVTDDRILNNRLAGTLDVSGGFRLGSYPVVPSPYVVKQIMMDMAVEVPGYEAHEVGAGLTYLGLALECFGTFGSFGELNTIPYNVF